MGEVQRISPSLWGLAETAQLQGDLDRAIALCEKGFGHLRAGRGRGVPLSLPGHGHPGPPGSRGPAGRRGVGRAGRERLTHRSIPGTLPSIDHARGLLQLASGDRGAAARSLGRAREAWVVRDRFWEGSWAALDLARGTAPADGGPTLDLVRTVRARAEQEGAAPLVGAADAVLERSVSATPWHPLTSREFSVANLVSAGMTNRQIASELFVSPRTVSAHVEHILTKLGAARRAEIAAWAARIDA